MTQVRRTARSAFVGFTTVLMLLSAVSSAVYADVEGEISLFAVAPVNRPAALLAPNAQTPPAPLSLNDEDKLSLIRAVDEDAGQDRVISDVVVLSAAMPFQEGQGMLTLVHPYTVHPETGIHMRGSDAGSVGVKVLVEEGKSYLLDFVVKSATPGTWRFDVEGKKELIEDPDSKQEHVLAALVAGSSGWTTVRLRRPESDFFLYSVHLTRFD